MNRKRLNNIIKTTVFLMAVSIGTVFGGSLDAFADSNIEKEFVSVISKYSNDEVVVENGISLRKGETLDLSKYKGWELSNNNTIEITENGVAKPKEAGTVFLSNKIGDKVYIVEVYVPSNVASSRSVRSGSVDRNYYKVFIDPGHGGSDNGASGNGLLEDELTLQISLKVKNLLQSRGIEVKMSRESDVYVSLGERTQMGNAYGADVFVSPHINSFTSSSAKGIETYYHTNKSSEKPLSSNIQDNAIKETGAVNRGVKSANFAVIRESSMPSSLFEAGFISNPEEAAKLGSSEYQNKLAKALADGIEKYLKDNIKLSGSGNNPVVPDTPSTPETPDSSTKTGTVTASSLNVRSGAGTSYSTIGSLKSGQTVQIVSTQGSWHKIKYGNGYGYVSSDYIKVNSNSGNQTPPTTDTPSTSTKKGTVNATSLNVRSGAGTSYSTIGSLKNGQSVEIVSTQGSWHKIKYGSGYGYVSADYIKVESQSSQPSNPSTPETPNTSTKSGTITADSLNIRSGAGTGHSVIGSLKRGAKVQVVSTSNGWHKIKHGSGYGYISADYVKLESQSSQPSNPNTPSTPETPSPSTKKGTVNATSLNVRSGAGTSYSTIGSLRNGASVEIVSTSNGWHKIKHGNGYGYISADYVKVSGGTTSNPSTGTVRTGTVTATSLNVRESASTNSLAIGAFKKGSKVKVLATSNGWHKIEYGYGYGYVSAQYVSF